MANCMTRSSIRLTVGTRASRLAQIQTASVVERLESLLPGVAFTIRALSSPGDRDRAADLCQAPADFFTRDLDEALLQGVIDCAIHSAKDMADPVADGLDWFWLPWREDARDCLVLARRHPMTLPSRASSQDDSGSHADAADCRPDASSVKSVLPTPLLPPPARIGVSSERRAAWCRRRYPAAQIVPIRGNIEQRLAQLDEGAFDATVMAGAALIRLGLQERISAWLTLEDLPSPPGQGALAITFCAGDPRLTALRTLFVKAVIFAGAGPGDAGLCTVDAVAALQRCDVCLHDALIDPRLLDHLPPHAVRIDVGKRAGATAQEQAPALRGQAPDAEGRAPASLVQAFITAEILRQARRGLRVVRLKGGDPGLFGRLAEETDALAELGLPFRVIPGVSALQAATSGTGILLTRRGESGGFCALTARRAGGAAAAIGAAERGRLPVVAFMAGGAVASVTAQLRADGWADDTPAAAISAAGCEDETVLTGTLATLAQRLDASGVACGLVDGATRPQRRPPPVLLVCGAPAARRWPRAQGALGSGRVLLTCSAALQGRAAALVRDYGGIPVSRPMVRWQACDDHVDTMSNNGHYDWGILTSPSAVEALMCRMRRRGIDLRSLPPLLATGPGTAACCREYGLVPVENPASDFGSAGLLDCARRRIRPGQQVVRWRSDRAGSALSQELVRIGCEVDDIVLYSNQPVVYGEEPPHFDMVLFTSGSGVESLLAQWGAEALAKRIVVAFPGTAVAALAKAGCNPDVIVPSCTVETAIEALAIESVRRSRQELPPDHQGSGAL